MGREVRRVPPNWEHPRKENGRFQPMSENNYEEVAQEYVNNTLLWSKGEHPDQDPAYKYWHEYDGDPPDEDYYVPYKKEEATWFQVYETVSEGTPLTPPFSTEKELVEYLVNHGDFWGHEGYPREAAENFVYKQKWAPSFVIADNKIYKGIEACGIPEK